MSASLSIEQSGVADFGACDCCGRSSRRVWGNVHSEDRTVACYFVHWTLGHVADHGASFDLILGNWGEHASAAERSAVSLDYRILGSGPALMVVDADARPMATELVGRALKRIEVVGQPIAAEVFAITDAILLQDTRIAELLGRPMA